MEDCSEKHNIFGIYLFTLKLQIGTQKKRKVGKNEFVSNILSNIKFVIKIIKDLFFKNKWSLNMK